MKYFPIPQTKIQHQKLIGCTIEAIKRKETKMGCQFPKAYVEFLLLMGNCANPLKEDHCELKDIERLNSSARHSLKLDNERYLRNWVLKETDLVFWLEDQGVVFTYFNLNEGEDPAVYAYNENQHHFPAKLNLSFSEFIMSFFLGKDPFQYFFKM